MEKKLKKKARAVAKTNNSIPAFLLKTYEILDNIQYADIISWNADGSAFSVKNINDFSEKVLPKYFKHSNFQSFVRQLNMYDFHKTRQENNDNEFKHPLFRQGYKHLLSEIKRKTPEATAGSVAGASSSRNPLNENLPQSANSESSHYWENQHQMQQPPQPQYQQAQQQMYPPQQHQQQQMAVMQEYSAYEQTVAIHPSAGGGIVANDPRFSTEVMAIRSKLMEVEGTTKTISLQNAQLIRENKLLWNEMLKTKEKSERKVEKLVLFIFSLLRPSLSKSLGNNPTMFKKIITDLALKNFQNGSNSNENNRLTKEESNEESKKEVTDALALFKESFEDSVNPDLEKFLKNYPNLMQKANSANSKTEGKKLMEDYFNYLQGKDKQQNTQQGTQPQQPQQQHQHQQQQQPKPMNPGQNNESMARSNSAMVRPPTMTANQVPEFSQFNEKMSNKPSVLNAYVQNPTQKRPNSEGVDKFQDPLAQNPYQDYDMSKQFNQPFKQQKTEPNAPNLATNTNMPQYRDPMGNMPSKPLNPQTNGDNMNAPGGFRPEMGNQMNNPMMQQATPGINPNFNPQSTFQYGAPGFNVPNGNQYFRDDIYKNQGFQQSFNPMSMNQAPYQPDFMQNPYNKFNAVHPGYMNQPPQGDMLGDFNAQAPLKINNPQVPMSSKPTENFARPNFNKPEQTLDYKPQPNMQGGFSNPPPMNNFNQYMPAYSNELDELKKNGSNPQMIKSAQAFPKTPGQGTDNVSRDNLSTSQGNRRNVELRDEFEMMNDGSVNMRGNTVSNDQDHFSRSYEGSIFDGQQDFF